MIKQKEKALIGKSEIHGCHEVGGHRLGLGGDPVASGPGGCLGICFASASIWPDGGNTN